MSHETNEPLRFPSISAPWTDEERLHAAKAAMRYKANSALELHVHEVARLVARIFDVCPHKLTKFYVQD